MERHRALLIRASQMMRRVLAFDHSSDLGGAEIGLANLAKEANGRLEVALLHDGPFAGVLRQKGLEPRLLDAYPTSPTSRVLRTSSIAVGVSSLVAQATRIRPRLLAALEESDVDVLVCNTLRASVLTLLCRLPRAVQTMVMVRDGLRPPYLTAARAVASQTAINLVGRAIVANSSWTASTIWSSRPKYVLPPVIARAFFDDPRRERPSVPPKVLILGRIARWKGQLFGLEAASRVNFDGEWELTVAGGAWFGEDSYFAEVTDGASRMHNPRPAMLGHVSDVKNLIDDHDIVVHTSTMPEPFGQVIVQGMARGKVVIASGEGGPAEIIEHAKDGLLYEPRNADSLARNLNAALQDASAREEMGKLARKGVMKFHPSMTVGRFSKIVSEL